MTCSSADHWRQTHASNYYHKRKGKPASRALQAYNEKKTVTRHSSTTVAAAKRRRGGSRNVRSMKESGDNEDNQMEVDASDVERCGRAKRKSASSKAEIKTDREYDADSESSMVRASEDQADIQHLRYSFQTLNIVNYPGRQYFTSTG
ncbi:hypothetical protein NEOLEDRAFT_746663 [Neolentinus lepideus HHB14362 ss-1]|uniref:Uncharacterized protein n=1 Tax=Neolentinus lepideus HHB14362 ss-1 TaxID=1314782 RepID=A0A165PT96_9AGAM|nr:hypothetical protein NEOLEDRAFT_746663 [Neolentinus lepideus HHB14362 ss-1]